MTTWGFHDPQWSIFFPVRGDSICNPETAFQTTVASLHPSSEAEFIELLRLNRIPVLAVKQVELNGDGNNDWIAIVNSDLYDDRELWPIITQNDRLLAVKNNLFFDSDSYYINIGQCTINSSEEATVVQTGGHINIFEITQEATGFHVNNLLDPIYRTLPQANPAQQDTNSQEQVKSCGLTQDYIWNNNFHRFQQVDATTPSKTGKIEPIENAIFHSDPIADPRSVLKAATSIQGLLNDNQVKFSVEERLYLRYLQGLAYELAGHERDAVNVYWQIWHDYPDSPYAMIIQRKLVRTE